MTVIALSSDHAGVELKKELGAVVASYGFEPLDLGVHDASDLSDGQWALIERYIPPARPGGCPRRVNLRAIVNAIFYLLRTGCQ